VSEGRLRGRFEGEVDPAMQRFSSSLEADMEMATEDIEGSRAHARVLRAADLLSEEEESEILAGLDRIEAEISSGEFAPGPALEDIHMAVEARLIELIGAPAGRLHTARSRNDQVATDVRLWLKKRMVELDAALVGLIRALLERAEADGRTLMPGYTHLQRAQPMWLGHQLLAHAWALSRDRERVAGALSRVDCSPLGAGALAGTPHPIDRTRAAELLGFSGPIENAMDAVAARDHLQEVASACAIAMSHASRQAGELVLWSTTEFDFVRLDDAYSTGSSIMPQKRNPDAPELVRGMAGRVFGNLQSLLVLTKGLPLAYNRDLQEDRAVFDAVRVTTDAITILASVWRTLTVNSERFAAEMSGESMLATELADALVTRGVPFREAHDAVGRLVAWCDRAERRLDSLSVQEFHRFHGEFPENVAAWLDPEAAVERRRSLGGTAWSEIERQIVRLRRTLP
jgi:argininosuccinate lyase